MSYLTVVFATDDGERFTTRHFGDADRFLLYRISPSNVDFLKEIRNSAEDDDETIHADPKKAGSIARLLKQEKVQVVVSKIFGPNIKRIKTKFVCILMKNDLISESISILQNEFEKIHNEWEKGEIRSFLKL
jgi:predicted Fe-Mo cluster-binding NifX family protein